MAFSIKSIKTYYSTGTVDIDEYNEDGMLIHSIMSLSPTESQESFYTEKDNVRYKEDGSFRCGTLPLDECKYDEQGRLMERISYLPNINDVFTGGDSSSKYTKYLHTYSDHDEHGNWLASFNYELEADGTKRLIDTTRREIEYY